MQLLAALPISGIRLTQNAVSAPPGSLRSTARASPIGFMLRSLEAGNVACVRLRSASRASTGRSALLLYKSPKARQVLEQIVG